MVMVMVTCLLPVSVASVLGDSVGFADQRCNLGCCNLVAAERDYPQSSMSFHIAWCHVKWGASYKNACTDMCSHNGRGADLATRPCPKVYEVQLVRTHALTCAVTKVDMKVQHALPQ
ncbi:hypothetical protein V8C86DRAFT_1498959 [Haematococcus lacustris]